MKFDLSKVNFSRFDIKRGLRLPTELNEKLAEDIGIMVGDGHIGKAVRPKRAVEYQIQCYGNAITDRIFYEVYVKNLKKNLFNLDFRFSNKPKNTCEIWANSKGLLEFYTKIIDLPLGRKDGIRIQSLIMESSHEIKFSFIRGLADSDFTLTFRKKDKKVMYYPLIKIGTASKNLITNIKEVLIELGFKPTVSYNLKSKHPLTKNIYIGHELSLNGKINLERWINRIGFSNPKNILKYHLWKKLGFCPRDNDIRKIMKMGPRGLSNPKGFVVSLKDI